MDDLRSNAVCFPITNLCCLLFAYLSPINKHFLAASFYPGRGDDSHILASLVTEHYGLDTDNPTLEEDQDFSTETEADWLDDDHLVESVDRTQAKMSDALALEVSSRQLF